MKTFPKIVPSIFSQIVVEAANFIAKAAGSKPRAMPLLTLSRSTNIRLGLDTPACELHLLCEGVGKFRVVSKGPAWWPKIDRLFLVQANRAQDLLDAIFSDFRAVAEKYEDRVMKADRDWHERVDAIAAEQGHSKAQLHRVLENIFGPFECQKK